MKRPQCEARQVRTIAGGYVSRTIRWALAGALLTLVPSLLVVGLANPGKADSTRLQMTKSNGEPVPEDSPVVIGQALIAKVTGFHANAVVLFQFGPDELPVQGLTNAHGATQVAFVVPKLRPDAYVLTANSDSANATFVVSVLASTSSGSPSPAPSASAASSHSVASTSSTSQHTNSSATELAHTGSTLSLPYWLTSMVLIAVGAALLSVGAPVVLGRHERFLHTPRHSRG